MKALAALIALSLAMNAAHSQTDAKPDPEDVKALQRQLAKDGALYISVSEPVARSLLIHGGDDVVIRSGGDALVVGTVLVGFEIDKTGVIRCPTAYNGPTILRHPATSAVAKWTFKPYKLNGQNIAVFASVRVKVTVEPPGDD
jgi:hypothetical protein